ncbi:helix-turn-helix domain-containing protein [Mesorhizobium sp. M0129]|uniref:helix-turn-helix domain-containing protein n=1 Tax=Mesorhizobium sp. M0129 TaxID=2956886 RepID=UPI0033373CD9
MSHDATGWAIKQRGLKPATKIVLWQLCDRFHPDNGCFPSQETLSADCEMSRSSLNEHLDALESAGLIRREQRRDGPTHRQKSTLYRFAFEGGFDVAKAAENKESPCPESGHGAVSGIEPKPCPENDESRVQNPDTNLVREPVKEPVEREAREDDPKKVEQAFWRMVRVWPGQKGLPTAHALKMFAALSPEDRAEAERKFPHWLALLKAQGKDHVNAPKTYFGERLWVDVPEPAEARPTAVAAPAFGPVWGAVRMRELFKAPAPAPTPSGFMATLLAQDDAKGRQARLTRQAAHGWPVVNRMHDGAESRKGITVAPELEALAALMEPVKVGSDLYQRWLAEHEKRGWPWLPDPGQMPVVYFPAGGPEALEQFEHAVRGNHDALKAAE